MSLEPVLKVGILTSGKAEKILKPECTRQYSRILKSFQRSQGTKDHFQNRLLNFSHVLAHTPRVDQVGIEERVARFNSRSIKKNSKIEALKLALSMLDLTTLDAKDTPSRVKQLCVKAIRPYPGPLKLNNQVSAKENFIPSVAAVCVYPSFIAVAKKALAGTSIKVASVATAFPTAMSSLQFKLHETQWAIEQGADEIDMVISRGLFLSGHYSEVAGEIMAVKRLCKVAKNEVKLKVILETGELGTLDQVRMASNLALHAGADFIKTSTGKIQPAATLPVTLVMLQAIRDYYTTTGKKVGMKPAGGISTSKLALQYLVMLKETLGEDWLTPKLFRFGASTLTNDLLRQLVKEITGAYQSGDYFTKD